MYYTVDRIEGDFAILQDSNVNSRDVKLSDLPENTKEGDIFRFENHIYVFDEERTKEVKKMVSEKFKKLFGN
jgi:hypothetical protein